MFLCYLRLEIVPTNPFHTKNFYFETALSKLLEDNYQIQLSEARMLGLTERSKISPKLYHMLFLADPNFNKPTNGHPLVGIGGRNLILGPGSWIICLSETQHGKEIRPKLSVCWMAETRIPTDLFRNF